MRLGDGASPRVYIANRFGIRRARSHWGQRWHLLSPLLVVMISTFSYGAAQGLNFLPPSVAANDALPPFQELASQRPSLTEPTDVAWEWFTIVELDRETFKFAFKRTIDERCHRLVSTVVAGSSQYGSLGPLF